MNIPDDVWMPFRLWTELVKYRSGFRCEDCGRSREDLVAIGKKPKLHGHHIDHDSSNNILNNGRCLCGSCHSKHHGGGSTKCEPGCTCGHHAMRGLPKRGSSGSKCKYGHEDWMFDQRGYAKCRTCNNKNNIKYYQDNRERLSAAARERMRAGRLPK